MKPVNGMDYPHVSILVKTAKLYYEMGLNQNEIAEQLEISRSYVSKLLAEARESEIVSFNIRDPLQIESDLERIVRQHYNLRKVIVAESRTEDNAANAVANKAALWLSSVVKSGDIIALGWGRTLYLLAKNLPQHHDISGVKTVSLYGQQSIMRQNVFSTEGLMLVAQAFNAESYVLTAPVFMSDSELKRRFLEEESIAATMEYAYRANIAVFTVGSLKSSSFLDQPGGLSEDEMQSLSAKGAVGDICLHIIDGDGIICDPKLDEQMIAVPLDILKMKDYRVAIASGRHKMDVVCAALKTGIANVLVVDEDIAKEIVGRINAGNRR